MREDLVIVDEEHIAYANLIKSIGMTSKSKMTTLIEQLSKVAFEGITDGNVHDNLVAYIEKLTVMQTQLNAYTEAISEEISEFLDEVEIEDCSIYEGGRVDGSN